MGEFSKRPRIHWGLKGPVLAEREQMRKAGEVKGKREKKKGKKAQQINQKGK